MHTIAQCLIWYLPPTMGYIHDQLLALGPERSVVFAAHPVEPERFPFDRVYISAPAEAPTRVSPRDSVCIPSFDIQWRPIAQREQVAMLHVHDGRIAPSFLRLARYLRIPIVTTFLGHDVSASLRNAGYVNAWTLALSGGVARHTAQSVEQCQRN